MKELKAAFKSRFVRISLLSMIATVLIFILLPPDINALVYKGYVYPVIRTLLNYTFGLFPFPSVFFVIAFFALVLLSISVIAFKSKSWAWGISRLTGLLCLIITIFFWVWGFHYNNPILVEQPHLSEYHINKEQVLRTFKRAEALREGIWADSISPVWPATAVSLVQDSGRIWLKKAIHLLGDQSTTASNRVRSWPKGFIIRWGIVGMYFPFSGEATVDAGLHAIRFPSTTLHEWAHSMGYTNEGDCNLLAYLAAQYSSDTFIRYSAEIERLREEMYLVAMQNYPLYETLKPLIPEKISRDLSAIQRYHARYKGKLADVGNWINDQYLKTLSGDNGIDEYWLWVLKLNLIEDGKIKTYQAPPNGSGFHSGCPLPEKFRSARSSALPLVRATPARRIPADNTTEV